MEPSVIAQILQALGQICSAIIGVLGLPALVISLVMVRKQLKLAANANRATVYQSVPQLMIEIDRLFVDRPELKPYFYRNKPISKDDPEYERVMSVAEILLDFMDFVTAVEPALPEYDWDSWKCYFQELAGTSPALRLYWEECGHWYPDPVRQAVGLPCRERGAADAPQVEVKDPTSLWPTQPPYKN